ncbi:MAG: prolyl oligopeptidase family serine peptidase [Myxococcota bacterium]
MLVPVTLLLSACSMFGPSVDEPMGPQPPAPARVEVVTDTFHGQAVEDPYRWLEAADTEETQAFVAAQNAYTEATLRTYPVREALKTELSTILGARRTTHGGLAFGGSRIFALRREPPKRQRFLVELDDLSREAPARTLLDPETMDAEGLTTIDWFVPSPDGRKVAVSLSRAGTESGDVYVLDVETGEFTEPPLPRVHGGTAGGALTWDPDGQGFLYTRYPRPGERPAEDEAFYVQLYHHALGDSASDDRYEMGKDFPRIAEIDVESHYGTGRVIVTVQDGDGGRFAHWLRDADGDYRQLSDFGDRTVMITFSEDGTSLLAVSLAGTPTGRIVRFGVDETFVQSQVVVDAKPDETIVTSFWSEPSIVELGGRVVYEVQRGGPSALRVVEPPGVPSPGPSPFDVGAVWGLRRTPDGRLLFAMGSYTEPWTWFRFDPTTRDTDRLTLDDPPAVKFSGVTVEREFATSKDGTKVPLNVLLPPGVERNGDNPCVVTGYGGFGISETPSFRASYEPLLRRGVIVVFTNLRGGGEFGETWHAQGMLENKQNVFDDFAAVLDHLVERDYTKPERIGIIGGSNGGLLMGAVLTQRPDAMAAVMASVGIFDMIRVETSANGAFNVTEFGTVQDESQFKALFGYSPYHHVNDGQRYPPVLFATGANDPRVDPMQSRKMTARLQAAQTGPGPILLRTNADAGHGSGTPLDARIGLRADQFAFLLHHIGAPMDARP